MTPDEITRHTEDYLARTDVYEFAHDPEEVARRAYRAALEQFLLTKENVQVMLMWLRGLRAYRRATPGEQAQAEAWYVSQAVNNKRCEELIEHLKEESRAETEALNSLFESVGSA